MLRLLELYKTIQGEGPHTGLPTTFVRFAGCNLKCPSWPCDTPFSIDPKIFEKEQELVDPRELGGEIRRISQAFGIHNVCLTGGEPFVQNHRDLLTLVQVLRTQYSVEIFSNGTIMYPEWVFTRKQIRFVLDWKLPGSGENSFDETRMRNVEQLWQPRHTIKFTIKDRTDFTRAHVIWRNHLNGNGRASQRFPGAVYAGPVWDGELAASDIVSLILSNKLPWRLNLQTHKYVFTADPNARGV